MAEADEEPVPVTLQRTPVDSARQRRPTATIVAVSLIAGAILGSVATLALTPTTSRVVSTAAEGTSPSTLQNLLEVDDSPTVPDQAPTPTTFEAAQEGDRPDTEPDKAPPAPATPPSSLPQGSADHPQGTGQRFVATLEAEPGWALTDRFAGTITVVETQDGSWQAEVAAEGLQPRHRLGAGVTWDKSFFSAFCTGMSDDAGRWTCTGRIDMQYVPPGAKIISGDLGEGSGRIWAHGPMQAA